MFPQIPGRGYEKRPQTWARQMLREPRMQCPGPTRCHLRPQLGSAPPPATPLAVPWQPPPPQAGSARSLPAPPGCGSHAHRSSSTTCSSSTGTPCTRPSPSFTATPEPSTNPLPPRIRAPRDWPRHCHVALSSLGPRQGVAADGWGEGPRHMTVEVPLPKRSLDAAILGMELPVSGSDVFRPLVPPPSAT